MGANHERLDRVRKSSPPYFGSSRLLSPAKLAFISVH
jgi:hypothetical protein